MKSVTKTSAWALGNSLATNGLRLGKSARLSRIGPISKVVAVTVRVLRFENDRRRPKKKAAKAPRLPAAVADGVAMV